MRDRISVIPGHPLWDVRVRREEGVCWAILEADFYARGTAGRSSALVSPHMTRRGMCWKCLGKIVGGDRTTWRRVLDSTAGGHVGRKLRRGGKVLARPK